MPRKVSINREVKLNKFGGDGQAFVRISKSKIKSIPIYFEVYSTYPLPRMDISARVRVKDLIKNQMRTAIFAKFPEDEETIAKASERIGAFEILDVTIEKLLKPGEETIRIVLDIEKFLSNVIESNEFIKVKKIKKGEI